LARRIARRPVTGQNERQVRRLARGRGDVTRTAFLWSRAAARLLLELRPPWRRSERGEGEGDAGVVVVDVGGVKIKENPDYQNNSAAHVHLITH